MSDIYDSAFRTIVNDCRQFLLPFLNEMFGEHYGGSEQIEFRPNEHFIDQQDAPDKKRVTDTHFLVTSHVTDTDKVADKITKQYHLECESSRYSPKILIRIFEYDAQIALDNAEVGEDAISVRFPHTGVLYLRSTEKTPDKMHVVIEVPGDSIEYEVPVTKVSAYTIDDIFEKKLYLLIPFYIFTYESGFSEYDTNEEKLESLKQEYQKIIDRLNDLTEKGEISSFDQRTIIELADNVMKELTRKYNNIQKEVGELMSGAMIQTEARKIRDEGIELGRIAGVEQGRNEGRAQMLIEVGREDGLDDATILNRLQKKIGLSLEAATSYLEKYGKSLV